MRSPADGGRGGEGTEACDAADKKAEEKDGREHRQNTFHGANGLRLFSQSTEVTASGLSNFELKGGKEQSLFCRTRTRLSLRLR